MRALHCTLDLHSRNRQIEHDMRDTSRRSFCLYSSQTNAFSRRARRFFQIKLQRHHISFLSDLGGDSVDANHFILLNPCAFVDCVAESPPIRQRDCS